MAGPDIGISGGQITGAILRGLGLRRAGRGRKPKAPQIAVRRVPPSARQVVRTGVRGGLWGLAVQFGTPYLVNFLEDYHFKVMLEEMDAAERRARADIKAGKRPELQAAIDRKKLEQELANRVGPSNEMMIDYPIPAWDWTTKGMPPFPAPGVPVSPPAGGMPTGPRPREPLSVATLSTPPVVKPKDKLRAAFNKAFGYAQKHPLVAAAALAGVAKVVLPKSRSRARAPAPAEEFEGLTDFEPLALSSGTEGGVPVSFPGALEELDQLEEQSSAPSRCEKISPRRSPGECRQGWFSESPDGLFLREWSRRPCR